VVSGGGGGPVNQSYPLLRKEVNWPSVSVHRAGPNDHAPCTAFPAPASADHSRLSCIVERVKGKVCRPGQGAALRVVSPLPGAVHVPHLLLDAGRIGEPALSLGERVSRNGGFTSRRGTGEGFLP
jgi:hypothetical protein